MSRIQSRGDPAGRPAAAGRAHRRDPGVRHAGDADRAHRLRRRRRGRRLHATRSAPAARRWWRCSRDHLAPKLVGRDPDCIEAIWKDLFFHTHATAVGAITSLALAAIDTALWDLRCKRVGLPLWKAAGGARAAVPVYTTEGGWLQLPVDALVAQTIEAKAQGFRGAKLKVGKPHVSEDVARLAAVREAVGDAFEIMVDANQCFTVSEAIRRARAFEPFGLAWLEEPLPAEDLGGHVELAAHTAIPIAVGESLYHPAHFREYLERDACSIVQVDCRAHRRHHALAQGRASRGDVQRRRLSALPDGAARVAHGGRAECGLGRVHSAARRHHDVAARDRRRLRDRARRRRGSASTGTSPPSTRRRAVTSDDAARRDLPIDSEGLSPMLTRASLTIRLHPNDDVVIARTQLVGGTLLADESVTVDGPRAARAQGRDPRDPRRRAGASATTRSSASPRATSPRASTSISTTWRWARSIATTRSAPMRSRRTSSTRPRRSWASCAPRPMRAASRRATTSASCPRSTARRPSCAGSPTRFAARRSRRIPNVDGVVALTHGSGCGMDTHGDGMQAAAAHARRLRAARELRRRARRRPGLRGEPDQLAARRAAACGKGRCCARSASRTPAARRRPSRTASASSARCCRTRTQ